MASMILMQGLIVDMASASTLMIQKSKSDLGLLTGEEKLTAKEKSLVEEIKAQIETSESVLSIAEISFKGWNKSMVSFFKSDNKTKYAGSKLTDAMSSSRTPLPNGIEGLKGFITVTAKGISAKATFHKGQKVHHDNGMTWTKTKTDAARFSKLVEDTNAVVEMLS